MRLLTTLGFVLIFSAVSFAQSYVQVFSTVSYNSGTNQVTGYAYTEPSYGDAMYYDAYVYGSIYNLQGSEIDYDTASGGGGAAEIWLSGTGNGCGYYQIYSTHYELLHYYVQDYYWQSQYHTGYWDEYNYNAFSGAAADVWGGPYQGVYTFFGPGPSYSTYSTNIIFGNTGDGSYGDCEPPTPTVTDVTAQGATKITQIVGDANIIHFVTPKASATPTPSVTLTATLSDNAQEILDDISWEGATESTSNPLEATVPKGTASKNVVKVKYQGNTIKELRVWVVWSTITSSDVQSTIFNTNTGEPSGPALGIKGGYNFTHTIMPSQVITDSNRPNLGGANSQPPPPGTHPFQGTSLADGANRKWDNSRQIRFKILNPAGLSHLDTSTKNFSAFPANSVSYPSNEALGNDDTVTTDETNNPYQNNAILSGFDEVQGAVCHRAGVNGDTFEYRYQFREFTRLEIEGTWYRISDFYPWRIHLVFEKVDGLWTGTGSSKALNNEGF